MSLKPEVKPMVIVHHTDGRVDAIDGGGRRFTPTEGQLDQWAREQREWNGGIDWSDCPLVQRHPDYLGGALAMRSAPRIFVEALIINHAAGLSAEELAEEFHGLNVNEVRAILAYYKART